MLSPVEDAEMKSCLRVPDEVEGVPGVLLSMLELFSIGDSGGKPTFPTPTWLEVVVEARVGGSGMEAPNIAMLRATAMKLRTDGRPARRASRSERRRVVRRLTKLLQNL